MLVNLDPWYAAAILHHRTPSNVVFSVLHHVNADDPNAPSVASADVPVAACEQALKLLKQLAPDDREVLLIENGVDVRRFVRHSKSSARQTLGISNDSFLVGYSGKYSSDYGGRKGLDILESVIRKLTSIDDRVRFVLCGKGWDHWLDTAGKDVRDGVINLGFLPSSHLPQFYSAMDVFVSTSRVEAGPATVLESLACGTPVVASKTGVVPKVVVDGRTGVCVQGDSADDFVIALVNLRDDPELRTQLASNARSMIENCWSWESKMTPFVDAIRQRLCESDQKVSRWTGPEMSQLMQRIGAIYERRISH
ncbi:glycosyltransferase family 4 protein [Roseiconus nitratireducens]|uniref:glycosyltransferase family 4 protein n=1 Tax=Roseiconus nitratireducens TaxID=2605748 RepID=UPI00137566CE|nr:glycosyltransferase family 4 protein [Roseiconus nitratireducens]